VTKVGTCAINTEREEFEAVIALHGGTHVDVGRDGERHLGVLEFDAARWLGVLFTHTQMNDFFNTLCTTNKDDLPAAQYLFVLEVQKVVFLQHEIARLPVLHDVSCTKQRSASAF
jgi:hypothetical protein